MKAQQLMIPALVLLGGAMLGRMVRKRSLKNAALAAVALAPGMRPMRPNAAKRRLRRPPRRRAH